MRRLRPRRRHAGPARRPRRLVAAVRPALDPRHARPASSSSASPSPAAWRRFFAEMLGRMRAYLAETGLRTVLTAADVDACIAGEAGIVLASRRRRLPRRPDREPRRRPRPGAAPCPAGALHQESDRRLPDHAAHARRTERARQAPGRGLQRQGHPGRPRPLARAFDRPGAGDLEPADGVLARLGRPQRRQLARSLRLPEAPSLARAREEDRRARRRDRPLGAGAQPTRAEPHARPGLDRRSRRHPRLCPRAGPPRRLDRRRPRGDRQRHRRPGRELGGQRLRARARGGRGAAGDEAAGERDREGRLRELRPGAEGRAGGRR